MMSIKFKYNCKILNSDQKPNTFSTKNSRSRQTKKSRKKFNRWTLQKIRKIFTKKCKLRKETVRTTKNGEV